MSQKMSVSHANRFLKWIQENKNEQTKWIKTGLKIKFRKNYKKLLKDFISNEGLATEDIIASPVDAANALRRLSWRALEAV